MRVTMNPNNSPIMGDSIIKTTAVITGAALTPANPPAAIAAPESPPMSVCDELDGIPKYQVSKFQQIAAITAANIRWKLINAGSTMPAMVAAILCSLKTKATKLKQTAQITA